MLRLLLALLFVTLIPLLSVVWVAIDVLRTRASRLWIFAALAMPIMGPLAYLVTVRVLGADGADPPWMDLWQRRRAARRRCSEMELRLGHWRAPGLVAELAKETWDLGRRQEAVALYCEAVGQLQDRPDVHLEAAECLLALGREAEALGLLEKLEGTWPTHKPAEVKLLLSRCLPEGHERLEPLLRDVMAASTLPEPRVRLACLLAARGEGAAALSLAQQVRGEAASWPRFFLKQNRTWLGLARRLARGGVPRLPSARALDARDRRLKVAAAATGLLLILALLGAGMSPLLARALSEGKEEWGSVGQGPQRGVRTPPGGHGRIEPSSNPPSGWAP